MRVTYGTLLCLFKISFSFQTRKALTRGRTDHFSNTLTLFVTLTYKFDLDRVNMNHRTKYVWVKDNFVRKLFSGQAHKHMDTRTQLTDCYTRPLKLKFFVSSASDEKQELSKCWDKRPGRITLKMPIPAQKASRYQGRQFLRSRGFKTSCNDLSLRKNW